MRMPVIRLPLAFSQLDAVLAEVAICPVWAQRGACELATTGSSPNVAHCRLLRHPMSVALRVLAMNPVCPEDLKVGVHVCALASNDKHKKAHRHLCENLFFCDDRSALHLSLFAHRKWFRFTDMLR